jgi:hypothetical protein
MCVAGSYCTLGASVALSCPTHYTSNAGATSASACVPAVPCTKYFYLTLQVCRISSFFFFLHFLHFMLFESVVSTIAGSPQGSSGLMDGGGISALFNSPAALALDTISNMLYVVDTLVCIFLLV